MLRFLKTAKFFLALQPMLPRFERESSGTAAASSATSFRMARPIYVCDEYVAMGATTFAEQLRSDSSALSTRSLICGFYDTNELVYDRIFANLIERKEWKVIERVLIDIHEGMHFYYADLAINRLARRERISPLPAAVVQAAYTISPATRSDFTDSCEGIAALGKLMGALVFNERWLLVDDFLFTARKGYRSGSRRSIAQAVLSAPRRSVPPETRRLAKHVNPLIVWRDLKLELFLGAQ